MNILAKTPLITLVPLFFVSTLAFLVPSSANAALDFFPARNAFSVVDAGGNGIQSSFESDSRAFSSRASLNDFSLKNLDMRSYARLQESRRTQTAGGVPLGPIPDNLSIRGSSSKSGGASIGGGVWTGDRNNGNVSRPIETPVTFVSYTPSVNLTGGGTVPGNAYNTQAIIYWETDDICYCNGTPGNWFSGQLEDEPGSRPFSWQKYVPIDTPEYVIYALTCNKYPSCNASAGTVSDSVVFTPQWSPSVSLSGPASVTAGQTVYLSYSATDIKTCTRSWTPGILTLSGGNPQTGTISAGTISAPTTFTMTCTGFDGASRQGSWPVGFIGGPTPYFFINSINLIIVGPGSGGKSNKATVGVTPGGGFVGTVSLNSANSALTSTGASLRISPTSISCNGTTCTTAEFWVETASNIAEGVYTITLTATPSGELEQKTQTIPLRVRKFVPAFQEI